MSIKLKVTTIHERHEGNRWVLEEKPEVDEYGPQQWPTVLDRLVGRRRPGSNPAAGAGETLEFADLTAGIIPAREEAESEQ